MALPEGSVPALVSEELWAAAPQVKSTNKERSVRSSKHPELFLLRAGFIRCGECGSSTQANRHHQGYHRYHCGSAQRFGSPHFPGRPDVPKIPPGGITAKKIDDIVWERVSRVLKDPEYLVEALQQHEPQDDTQGNVESIDRRIAELTAERNERYQELRLFKSEASKAPIAAEIDRLSDLIAQFAQERDRLANQATPPSVSQADVDELVAIGAVTSWAGCVARIG